MTTKTTRIISIVLMAIPSLMIAMSGAMKLVGAEQVVTGLTKAGLSSYITLFGIIELISLTLFIYPKTYKIGFLLLTAYLGGALSIELAGGQPPMAAILLTLIWVSVYLRDHNLFLQLTASKNK
ncbi:MAG: DoxX family protein [Bacteroidota bacterium]|nr:DoxX family protein [Bacteroidota bacterium]